MYKNGGVLTIETNKVYNLDCLEGMGLMEDESVDLIVTSPPYYNAREYSQWDTLDEYLDNMRGIFNEAKRVLKNYKVMVVNIGDVVGSVSKESKNSSKRKIPLGAYFTIMLEELGLVYIDDIIWDKGEVQSKRNFVGEPYPHQKYPINCYEHILIFRKFEKDKEKPNCPLCGKNKAVVNGVVNSTTTYECKNPECKKSEKGRGVRYSSRQNIKLLYQKEENKIGEDILKIFRRDIVKISPVIKINNKKENKINHTAPFPKLIPEYAIKYYSGVGDVVLDMFMGSGTTAIVCKETDREYIGYELNKEYYNILIERLNNIPNK